MHIAQCGKVLAGWSANSTGNIVGGFAPNPEHMLHKKDEFKMFCKSLFYDEKFIHNDTKIFLGCAITRFYKPFREFLKECPDKKYETIGNHPLIMEINMSLNRINCCEDDLHIWCQEINSGFVRDNFNSLSIKYMDKIDPSGDHKRTLIDQRSVVDVVQDLALSVDMSAKETRHLDWDCKELLKENKNLTEKISDLNENNKLLTKNLKLCVEHQMTTNKKVDMMEKYLIGLMRDMKELKEIITDVSKKSASQKSNESHTSKLNNVCNIGKCHVLYFRVKSILFIVFRKFCQNFV